MIQNITIGDLTIDCANAYRAREFYAELTGWERAIAYDCLALKADNGMILLFEEPDDIPYAPPVWPEEHSKQQKQMHFDFHVDDLPAAVEEAIRLGASKSASQFGGDHYITMLDPEGHPFCLCKKSA
jgi:predicted enzyme related to lactoylglutathione lyase